MKRMLCVFGVLWMASTAPALATVIDYIAMEPRDGACDMEEILGVATDFRAWMSKHGVSGRFYTTEHSQDNAGVLVYVSRAPNAEVLGTALDAFAADPAAKKVSARAQKYVKTTGRGTARVYGKALTFAPGDYVQLTTAKPTCSPAEIHALVQRFSKATGMDTELLVPFNSSALETVTILSRFSSRAAWGKSWDMVTEQIADAGSDTAKVIKDFGACGSVVSRTTFQPLFKD